MNLSLNQIKNTIIQNKSILIAIVFIILLIIFLVFKLTFKTQKLPDRNVPFSIIEQPVKNGQFDPSASISQQAKEELEVLRPHLPYQNSITTFSGQTVTYALIYNSKDPYTLYIEIININFQITEGEPQYAKSVQDFRETAQSIFDWIKEKGVNPFNLFIVWGTKGYVQDQAEKWLSP